MIFISLFLIVLVAGSCTAVMYLFFKRLRRIEQELWGQKAREAADTAATEQTPPAPEETTSA